MHLTRTFVGIALVCAVSGCSGGGTEQGATTPETSSPSGPDLPLCEDIWVIDQKLPEGYRGCIDRNGEGIPASFTSCADGAGAEEDEFLYWHEDGPLRYLAWESKKRDYPVEYDIEDGNRIGTNNVKRLLETAREVCAW